MLNGARSAETTIESGSLHVFVCLGLEVEVCGRSACRCMRRLWDQVRGGRELSLTGDSEAPFIRQGALVINENEEQWHVQGAFQSPVKATGHSEPLDVILTPSRRISQSGSRWCFWPAGRFVFHDESIHGLAPLGHPLQGMTGQPLFENERDFSRERVSGGNLAHQTPLSCHPSSVTAIRCALELQIERFACGRPISISWQSQW